MSEISIKIYKNFKIWPLYISIAISILFSCYQFKNKPNSTMNTQDVDLIKINANLVKQNLLRPPHMEYVFNFYIENNTSNALWFLLPFRIEGSLAHDIGGVGGYEIFSLNGDNCIIGRFIGNKSFFALKINPNNEVVINNLPVNSVTDAMEGDISLTILTTDKLEVNKIAMSDIFPKQSTPINNSINDYSKRRMLYSKFIDTLEELPVEWNTPTEHKIVVKR